MARGSKYQTTGLQTLESDGAILLEHVQAFGAYSPCHFSSPGASPVLNGWVRYDMMMMMMKIVGGEEEHVYFTAPLCSTGA